MKALQFSVTVPQWLALKALGAFSRRLYYRGPLATARLVERDEPGLPGPDWVRVRTHFCGFCASDLNLLMLHDSPTASPFTSFPAVMGHEVSGEIAEIGGAVKELKQGDRVTVCPALSCVQRGIDPVCRPCSRGEFAACENTAEGRIAPGMFTGINRDTGGGFAPSFVAHESQCFKLPLAVSSKAGALIEPLSVGLRTVTTNPPQPGEDVLIIGGGVIGCMIVQALRALKYDCRITVAERSQFAADFCREMGADRTPVGGDLFAHTAEVTGARRYKPLIGADILMGGFNRIYDTVGSSATLNASLRCLAGGGILSQVGIGGNVRLDLTPLWLKKQTIVGVYGCGFAAYKGETRHMFDIAIDLTREGLVDLERMVTHTFALGEFGHMIEVNLNKEANRALKTVVSFL